MILPEELDETWHEEIQNLWMERATLRLVFKDELDPLYDAKYTKLLLTLNQNEPEIHNVNLFSELADHRMWKEDTEDSAGFHRWSKDHELLDNGPQASPTLIDVLEVLSTGNHNSTRVET